MKHCLQDFCQSFSSHHHTGRCVLFVGSGDNVRLKVTSKIDHASQRHTRHTPRPRELFPPYCFRLVQRQRCAALHCRAKLCRRELSDARLAATFRVLWKRTLGTLLFCCIKEGQDVQRAQLPPQCSTVQVQQFLYKILYKFFC